MNIELLCTYFEEYSKECKLKMIEITNERKKFVGKILEVLVQTYKTRPCILLNGPQGTGKSSTLLLLCHILTLHSDIKIVFLSKCSLIQSKKPDIIMEEINHIFPEIPIDSKLDFIKDYLRQEKNNNIYTIFICDQVNELSYQDFCMKISPFISLPWSMIICSQSYNNQLNPEFKKCFQDYKTIEIKEWINEDQLKKIIENEAKSLKLKAIKVLK